MHVMLLLAGVIAVVLGVVMLIFAIPVFRSDLANPLLVSATVAISGGFILIALGAIVFRLWRLAELLETQPMPRSLSSGATPGWPSGAITPMSPPAESPAESSETPGEHPRSEGQPAPPFAAVEQSLVPAPLAGMPGPLELRATGAADEAGVQSNAATEWPQVTFSDRLMSPEAPTEPAGTQHAWAKEEDSRNATDLLPEREPARTDDQQPTLLKSGVIEGMAYTLYSDGSVEAELPQGTMRFESIAEWRIYMRTPA